MLLFIQIALVSLVVASACNLIGVFLVLKRMTLISDALGHSILLGIVRFAWISRSLHSPLLILGASLSGLLLIVCIEWMTRLKFITSTIAMAIMYPLFFSLAVILINVFAKNVHLDTHTVAMGEVAFTVFDPLIINGKSIGPKALYNGLVILGLNVAFIVLAYKPLKLTCFDADFAKTINLSPLKVHYLLMALASITMVNAFQVTGSILMVAFIAAPPATAFLLIKRLESMLVLSLLITVITCLLGIAIAFITNTSITGCIAATMGAFFLLTATCSPQAGLIFKRIRILQQKKQIRYFALLIHIYNHRNTVEEANENTFANLKEHFRWSPYLARRVLSWCEKKDLLRPRHTIFALTPKGEAYLKKHTLISK